MQKYTIFLLLSILCGCITENLLPCGTTVCFSYRGDGTDEIFDQKIEVVNLYVYDRNNDLFQTKVICRDEWSGRNKIPLDLPAGTYDLICWGGIGDYIEVEQAQDKNKAEVYADQLRKGEPVTTIDSIYYGSHRLIVDDRSNTVDTVVFGSAHVKMLVNIQGVNLSARTINSYRLEVDNVYSGVYFDSVTMDDPICFQPVAYEYEHNSYTARFNLFRFKDDNDIVIRLPGLSFSLELKEFMRTHNLRVEGIHEAFIGIRIYFNGVKIEAQPWDESTLYPEW